MTSIDLTGSYRPNVPGASTLSDARTLYVSGRRVTALVEEINGTQWLTVFVGGSIVLTSRVPAEISSRAQVNEWVTQYVLQNQDTKGTTVISESVPDQPSSWAIESYDEASENPEPETVVVTVSSTTALIRTLETAGFTVFAQRFPAADTVSYIQVSRAGSSLTFRRANENEPTPARTDDFVKIDAESYRYLAETIAETMADPDQWDGDDAEPYILAQYVKWLAKGKPVDEDGYPDKRDDAAAGRPDFEAVLSLVRSAFELADGRLYSCDDFELSEHGTLERVRDGLAQALSALTGRPQPDMYVCLGCGETISVLDQPRHVTDECTVEPEPHVHHFPLPADAETDPTMEPADCACGVTFAEHSTAETDSVIEMDIHSAYPTVTVSKSSDRYHGRYVSGTRLARVTDANRPLRDRWLRTEDGYVLEFDSLESAEAFAAKLNENPETMVEVCRYFTSHVWNGIPAVTMLDCGPVGKIPACQKCVDFYARMS